MKIHKSYITIKLSESAVCRNTLGLYNSLYIRNKFTTQQIIITGLG